MDTVKQSDDGGQSARARPAAPIMVAFLGAIFLSAALIFVIQPMFTRFVLPRLGGSPGVWSVAMAFFQAVLFAGYLYAHLSARWLSPRVAVLVHIALTLLALLWLPLGIARGWGEPPATGESFWLMGLFAASIGVPYLALSANGPLLQSWFARAAEGTRADPYFLYAVSNAGSFLALLAYPLAIEPLMTLVGQSRLWTIGYAVLLLFIMGCGALVWSNPSAGKVAEIKAEEVPRLADLARWSALAAVPTALLVAVTAHISTDIAAIPLVWVIPLALYLLTLVIVFRSWSQRTHKTVSEIVPWALLALTGVLVLFPESDAAGLQFWAELFLHIGTFVLIAFMCHGELVHRKPPASQLTSFYLAMSFGGMVGGVFASLVAPNVFNWIAEYPIVLVAAALCLPTRGEPAWAGLTTVRLAAAAVAAVVLVPGLIGHTSAYQSLPTGAIGAACLVLGVLVSRSRLLLALALALAFASIRLYPQEGSSVATFRSFFGVLKVHDSEDGRHRVLMHGTTLHGAQRFKNDKGEPETGRPESLTYYRVGSPIHDAIEQARANKKGAPLKIGVVGLGAGSMACLVDPADEMTYFEIDPAVVQIASDPRRFTFLSTCQPKAPIVIGDARLTLAKVAKAAFDVIVVDAFASDAIPTHLLTREALLLYADKLAPGGVIALHVSSRHMELTSVAHSTARAAGLASRDKEDDLPEGAQDEYRFDTTVVALAHKEEDLAGLRKRDEWYEADEDELSVRPWTDDYSNPLGAIWRHMRQ